MLSPRLICLIFLTCTAMADSAVPASSSSDIPSQIVPLTVAKNTPLQIALDKEVRLRKPGQAIHGRLVQPVYAFDRLVVPAGAEVNGHITSIEKLSGKKRTLGILNADLTPTRKVNVEFNELVLADGRKIPFQADITPGSGQVMQLVSSKDSGAKKNRVSDAASKKVNEAKQEAKRQWNQAIDQVKAPGKIHRLERYAIGQLPARPQYIPAGTVYFAALQKPLDFGSIAVSPQVLATIGTNLPKDAFIHALLVTPLDSATTQKGAEVEAVLSRPVFDGNRLVLPEGSRLKGVVLEAKPARRMHHNGQLRITFREIVPPDGVKQKIVASLEGIQAGQNEHVKLDSEGGAEASTPKTRYLSTGVSLALASASFHQHTDNDGDGQGGNGVAGGAASFRLVGIVLGAAVRSQPLGMAMGAYGASMSVYTHFLSKGHEVVFPRNTAMEISIGPAGRNVLPTSQQESEPSNQPNPQ